MKVSQQLLFIQFLHTFPKLLFEMIPLVIFTVVIYWHFELSVNIEL